MQFIETKHGNTNQTKHLTEGQVRIRASIPCIYLTTRAMSVSTKVSYFDKTNKCKCIKPSTRELLIYTES